MSGCAEIMTTLGYHPGGEDYYGPFAPVIGRGAFRKAYRLSDNVVRKMAHTDWDVDSNENEWDTYCTVGGQSYTFYYGGNNYSIRLAKALGYAESNDWIDMEYVDSPTMHNVNLEAAKALGFKYHARCLPAELRPSPRKPLSEVKESRQPFLTYDEFGDGEDCICHMIRHVAEAAFGIGDVHANNYGFNPETKEFIIMDYGTGSDSDF